jgi:hypothetical protein
MRQTIVLAKLVWKVNSAILGGVMGMLLFVKINNIVLRTITQLFAPLTALVQRQVFVHVNQDTVERIAKYTNAMVSCTVLLMSVDLKDTVYNQTSVYVSHAGQVHTVT